MKVYKGTDKDMKCRGFQYKLGEAAVLMESRIFAGLACTRANNRLMC